MQFDNLFCSSSNLLNIFLNAASLSGKGDGSSVTIKFPLLGGNFSFCPSSGLDDTRTRVPKFAFLPQFRDEHIVPSGLYDYMSRGNEQNRFVKPRQNLRSVLERDDDIRERFLVWCKDSISYEKQIIDHMHDLQSEVGLSLDS